MATYSRKVEYLVRKRHRMLKHVMSMLTEEGGFWMNSVYINKDSICRLLGVIGVMVMAIAHQQRDMSLNAGKWGYRAGVIEELVRARVTLGLIDARRDKAKIYFALANSFGRIVDLGNVANTVFCGLQLFEEYRNFGLFDQDGDPMSRFGFPYPQQSFAQLHQFSEVGEDLQITKGRMMLEDQSEDVRKFINKGDKIVENTLLPFPENSTTNFDTYYENTVQDDVEEGMK